MDDLADEKERAEWLWEELEELMRDDAKRQEMAEACRRVARANAAREIAERLMRTL